VVAVRFQARPERRDVGGLRHAPIVAVGAAAMARSS
jgi:hypothetical protein